MKRNRSKRNSHCTVKLDMQKAYDRLEWVYLEGIMKKIGLSPSFVDAVMRGVRSVTFSVPIDGGRTREFTPSRGIRQGDPTSPYALLLASEGFSSLMRHAGQQGELEGIQIAPTPPRISILLFADDCLLFSRASSEKAGVLKEVLNRYCQGSGQRINNQKSSICSSKGCPAAVRNSVKGVPEIMNESLSEKYLGLPSDVGRENNGTFAYIKDRIWKLLQGCMEKMLAGSGKEILIKSIVQPIPTYSMSVFKLPRGLCQCITAMVRKFWWGSKAGERKTAWVSWDTMTMPKYRGVSVFGIWNSSTWHCWPGRRGELSKILTH